eukprot:6816327-Lingulodinium_polyedra.AAC.1
MVTSPPRRMSLLATRVRVCSWQRGTWRVAARQSPRPRWFHTGVEPNVAPPLANGLSLLRQPRPR